MRAVAPWVDGAVAAAITHPPGLKCHPINPVCTWVVTSIRHQAMASTSKSFTYDVLRLKRWDIIVVEQKLPNVEEHNTRHDAKHHFHVS